ncbi:hypothetical protein [Treponema sp.]|uniref:hypothetical protein n=1 Tax=Treponema sp. TaxID=166 RepID=UPI003F0717CD
MSFGCSFFKNGKCLFIFAALFFLTAFCAAEESGEKKEKTVTVVTIIGADYSDYKKNEGTGEDEIHLAGNVKLSIEKEKSRTEIRADNVTFNRSTQMLYAQGSVEIVKHTSENDTQNILASTVLLNTSTMEGIFDGGRIVNVGNGALNLPSDSTMIVASEIFGRDSSGSVTFKNASLTFCDDDDPHWRIKASRIWLLPGSEFAFFNALVYVGKIPVMYLPVFYYPKDELLFNPAFGYDERLGYYFQTTTYLVGRKPLEAKTDSGSEDSLSDGLGSFMRPSVLKEQKREGLVLHNLDENYKGSTDNYLKFIADYYANLGFSTGFSGMYKPSSSEYISSIKAGAQIAFTNTVFYSGGKYTPYSSEGKVERDESSFLGFSAPFRYSGRLKMNIKKPFVFNLSMPFYSDPFFTEDFENRSEYLDWIHFLLGEVETDDNDTEDTSAQTSSFEWKADASYSFPLPGSVKPFINNLSITNLSADISFNSKSRSDDDFYMADIDWRTYSPERSFFYPYQVVPFKISAKIEGTIFEYPSDTSIKKFDSPSFASDLEIPDELKSPKDSAAQDENSDKDSDKNSDALSFSMQELEPKIKKSDIEIKGIEYKLGYSIVPQFTSQLNYNSSELKQASDFDWSNFYSTYYQVKIPTTISSELEYREPFLLSKNDFTFNPIYQEHPVLDGYTSESSKNAVKLSDYNARKLDLINDNTFSVKPLAYSRVFRESCISWKSSVKLVKTEFIGDAEKPEWNYAVAKLTDEEAVTLHTLSAKLAAQESDDFSQAFTVTSNLPPQLDEYTFNASLKFPHASLSAELGIQQENEDTDNFVWNPFKQSASLKFLNGDIVISESFNYEMEEKHSDSMKLSFSWKDFQVSYIMQYTTCYDFDINEGWVAKEDKKFVPYTLSFAYASSAKNFRYWKKRITWAPSLTTGLVYDCVRPTSSYFRFVPAMTFKIYDAFDLTFSAETQNDVVFRYFQRFTKYDGIISGEENMFKDLWNSFSFWGDGDFYDSDQIKRRSSGFKLKTLKVSITRNLHDWDMSGSISFKPRIVTDGSGNKKYDYHPYITFAISWHPIPSFRTEVIDEYGEWQLQ